MQRRTSLFTFAVLVLASLGSMGFNDCGQGEIVDWLARTLSDHEERISDLEACECDGVLAPVCGADGRTYVNRCEARCSEVRVVALGHCEPPECGGSEGIACEEGEFCEQPAGCMDLSGGVCEEKPLLCTREYVPVCGCDRVTYGNDCERRAVGAPLAHRGECRPEPRRCEVDDACADDEFCRRSPGVCDQRPGSCTPRPEACTQQYDPVCGCDGKTYSNACAAASAGASVEYEGECRLEPVVCSEPEDCTGDELCSQRECGEEGVCKLRPRFCPLVSRPVCGCDGETYGNRCEAAMAGVSVDHDRECRDEERPICHVPPGNPFNRHTIWVGESAVRAHLGHGDYEGHCED